MAKFEVTLDQGDPWMGGELKLPTIPNGSDINFVCKVPAEPLRKDAEFLVACMQKLKREKARD